MSGWLSLLPVIPGGAAVLLALFGRRMSYAVQSILAVLSVLLVFLMAVNITLGVESFLAMEPVTWNAGAWILTKDLQALFGYYLDSLSLPLVLLITGFGTLIVTYSVQYMHGDEDSARYFASITFFIAAMLLLVIGENLFLVFLGWEGVGLASYLLIGHYWKSDYAPPAAYRAFFFNRVGDVFFLIGVFLLFDVAGTASFAGFHELLGLTSAHIVANVPFDADQLAQLQLAALFLLGGAFGKSAQMPLHVWLPDAMAGPTPVSALIHAATMVTAGVYLLARLGWLFTLAPVAMNVVFVASLITLIVAAILACMQYDVKKVLAYSTLAHLALMFLAHSANHGGAAMMHLFGHAAFKALLFLAAGSVIAFQHHEQDLRKLTGALRTMPVTRAAFWIGALGAAGFVPYVSAAFFSKEFVMHALAHPGGEAAFFGLPGAAVYWTVFVAELLGLVYIFRMLGYLEGNNKAGAHFASESGLWIRMVLGVLIVAAPAFGIFSATEGFGGAGTLYYMIAGGAAMSEPEFTTIIKNAAAGLAIGGLVFVSFYNAERRARLEQLAIFRPADVFARNFYFDDVYRMVLLQPLSRISRGAYTLIESPLVIGGVRRSGLVFVQISRFLRRLQRGLVDHYAYALVTALALMLGAALLWR